MACLPATGPMSEGRALHTLALTPLDAAGRQSGVPPRVEHVVYGLNCACQSPANQSGEGISYRAAEGMRGSSLTAPVVQLDNFRSRSAVERRSLTLPIVMVTVSDILPLDRDGRYDMIIVTCWYKCSILGKIL